MSDRPWFVLEDEAEIASPALLIYPDRVAANIDLMIEIAGDPERLRPHVKTHKLAEIVRMQLDRGVSRFKCATIAEVEMVADTGGEDVLLAYQPVGPNMGRLCGLVEKYPGTRFSAVVDDVTVVSTLSEVFSGASAFLGLYLDVDCGMHRSGIAPGTGAKNVYRSIVESPNVEAAGLHVYDGHVQDAKIEARRERWEADMVPIMSFREELLADGLPVPGMIGGGTPTFPLHAAHDDRECSPGTTLLWDVGYGGRFGDLPFQWAAVLLTRVVSKPGKNRLCLDLGHKAVAADKPQPRALLLNIPDSVPVVHSEEHLMVETPAAGDFAVGDCIYAVPTHICPTVALHDDVVVVREGKAAERWQVKARRRRLGF